MSNSFLKWFHSIIDSLLLDDQYNQILKDIGDGLSLISVQNLENQSAECSTFVPKNKQLFQEKYSVKETEEINHSLSSHEPNEQEKILCEKISDNRQRILMQHQQLMMKAAQLLCFPSIEKDPSYRQHYALTSGQYH